MNSPHGAKTNDSAESSNGLLLSARGIGKSFSGVPALRDGQLSLRPGSVRALCGANWSRAEALSLMENWLTAHPDQIQGVIGQNDEMALGALEAIRAAKLDVKKFAIAGIDGVTDAMIAAKAGEMVSFLQDAKAQAQGALDLALRAIKGESYQPQSDIWKQYEKGMPWNGGTDKHYNVPWTPITPENVDALLKQRQQ